MLVRNFTLAAIIALALIMGSSRLTRGHEWGDDFASYIMQARSILNGDTQEFVERNAFTIFESSEQIGPVAYPWGYPLALAPAYAIKGNSPLGLKLPGLLFFAGFLVSLYLLTANRLTRAESLLLVSLFAFNPMLIEFLDHILSDIPFLFLSTLALVLMKDGDRPDRYGPLWLGAVIAAAFFVRTTGILLLASYLVVQTFAVWRQRADRVALQSTLKRVLTVSTTFALLWAAYALLFPGGGESYFAQYEDFQLETVSGFASGYFGLFSLFFGESTGWRYLYYIVLIFAVIGAWVRRKDEPVFIIFFALWMLLLVTWPFWQGPRFIFPLLPIFIYFAFHGMQRVIHALPAAYQRAGNGVSFAFWLVIIGIFLFDSGASAYDNLRNDRVINGPYDPVSREVYSFIQEETPPDSVVVFFKPRAMRLMTGRDTLMINECKGIPKGDYVVLSKKVGENNQVPPEQIAACNLSLKEVFDNRRFVIHQILK